MKKRIMKWESIIREVIFHAGVGGCADAEIHAIMRDGTEFVYHYRNPTDADIAILRNSVGKLFKCEVSDLERGYV